MTGTSVKEALELRLLTTFEELEALEEEWAHLQNTRSNACLTNSFNYVYMAYRHFLKDSSELHFITLYSAETSHLVGIFPFVVTDENRYQLNFRRLSFIGLSKFKKPTPLISDEYTDQCWERVLLYTLAEKTVWQVMDLGEADRSPIRERGPVSRFSKMAYLKGTKQSISKPVIDLTCKQNEESYFIKDNSEGKERIKYKQEFEHNGYEFKVYDGSDLDYCYSQIMAIAGKNNDRNHSMDDDGGDRESSRVSSLEFYQKYFCRMAFVENLTFSILSKRGKVISIEIGYIEQDTLYLDTNVVDEELLRENVDVLCLDRFLNYHAKRGIESCEFLCSHDTRIPYLMVENQIIEKQTLSRVCPKYLVISCLDACSQIGSNIQQSFSNAFGKAEEIKA